MNFIWLLFAHYIGDIALQSDWQAQNKSKYWYVLFSHAMVWTTCVSIALDHVGLFLVWKAVFLVLGHMLMDYWKSSKPKTPETWWLIYPDQLFHLLQLIAVYTI